MDAAWPMQKVCIGGETYYRAWLAEAGVGCEVGWDWTYLHLRDEGGD